MTVETLEAVCCIVYTVLAVARTQYKYYQTVDLTFVKRIAENDQAPELLLHREVHLRILWNVIAGCSVVH